MTKPLKRLDTLRRERDQQERFKWAANKRADAYEKVVILADEFCTSIDCAAEDIGGSRPVDTILQCLGPAVDAALRYKAAHAAAKVKRRGK